MEPIQEPRARQDWSVPSRRATGKAVDPRTVLLVSAAATLVLYAIPYGQVLARPLVLLSTLAHEMGHGLVALFLGGSFQKLEMWLDGSGVAHLDLTGFGRLRQGLALAGGLVGPAVAAALCFALGKTGRGARACLIGLGLFLLLAEILVVRNAFGFVFVGLVAAVCLAAGLRLAPERARWVLVFLGVQLALSVFSRADYLFAKSAGLLPSDVMQMQQVLFLPYWFWGFACGAFAVAVLVYGVRSCWGGRAG